MRPVEVSTEVRLPPEQVWDFMWGDGGPPRFLADMHRLGYWRDVTGIDEYDLPPGGMPRYRMSRRFGPLPPVRMRTEYTEFERPTRAVNHALDTPLHGDFVATNEPIAAGTRITWRWEVRAENAVLEALLRPLRPLLVGALRKNLDEYARAAATSQGSDRP